MAPNNSVVKALQCSILITVKPLVSTISIAIVSFNQSENLLRPQIIIDENVGNAGFHTCGFKRTSQWYHSKVLTQVERLGRPS